MSVSVLTAQETSSFNTISSSSSLFDSPLFTPEGIAIDPSYLLVPEANKIQSLFNEEDNADTSVVSITASFYCSLLTTFSQQGYDTYLELINEKIAPFINKNQGNDGLNHYVITQGQESANLGTVTSLSSREVESLMDEFRSMSDSGEDPAAGKKSYLFIKLGTSDTTCLREEEQRAVLDNCYSSHELQGASEKKSTPFIAVRYFWFHKKVNPNRKDLNSSLEENTLEELWAILIKSDDSQANSSMTVKPTVLPKAQLNSPQEANTPLPLMSQSQNRQTLSMWWEKLNETQQEAITDVLGFLISLAFICYFPEVIFAETATVLDKFLFIVCVPCLSELFRKMVVACGAVLS